MAPLEPQEKGLDWQSRARMTFVPPEWKCLRGGIASLAANGSARRFASAPIIRCCAAVGGSAALRMRHTPCGCRSAYLVGVQPNFRLPPVSTMRRASAMPHSAGSLPPSKRHSRLTIVRRGCKRSRLVGIHGEAMYTAPTLRSACSSSSHKLPMCGVEGEGPSSLSLGGCKGGCSLSEEREHPPLSHPHTVWGNHNLVICTPAVFSINFLVPTVSNATSSSASPPIGVTEMTSPSPNVLWWICSPEES